MTKRKEKHYTQAELYAEVNFQARMPRITSLMIKELADRYGVTIGKMVQVCLMDAISKGLEKDLDAKTKEFGGHIPTTADLVVRGIWKLAAYPPPGVTNKQWAAEIKKAKALAPKS
ncbi:MAG: hypothetical protein PHW76_09770 [Alphaproteobacteria bacterium]|nr:hypothetical protein [Alphaproteobacteria bacterium]